MPSNNADRRRTLSQALPLALVIALALTAVACGDDDSADPCLDPCAVPGDLRCGGSVLQECVAAANGCLLWAAQQDCAAQGLICLTQANGPECGMLCTDPCSTGQSRCSFEIWQTCEVNEWGCLRWEDYQDCAATSLVCEDTTGDASCFAP